MKKNLFFAIFMLLFIGRLPYAFAQTNITVNSGVTTTLAAGTYGDITVNAGGILLTSGTGAITVTGIINVQGTFTITGNVVPLRTTRTM